MNWPQIQNQETPQSSNYIELFDWSVICIMTYIHKTHKYNNKYVIKLIENRYE